MPKLITKLTPALNSGMVLSVILASDPDNCWVPKMGKDGEWYLRNVAHEEPIPLAEWLSFMTQDLRKKGKMASGTTASSNNVKVWVTDDKTGDALLLSLNSAEWDAFVEEWGPEPEPEPVAGAATARDACAAGTLNAILNVIGDYASHPKKKRNLADLKSGLEAVLSPPRQNKKMKACKAPVKKARHLQPPQVASS